MKKIIFIFIFVGLFCGCSSSEEEVPEDNIAQGGSGEGIGPFDLKLAQNGGLEANQFSIQIAQNEGKVEFNLEASGETTWMKIRSHLVTVTGCDAGKVEAAHIWEAKTGGNPSIVSKGDYFSSLTGQDGRLTVVFKNMLGCDSLTYKLVVDSIEDPFEIPKSWSFDVDADLLGKWKNVTEGLNLEVDEFYTNLESTKAGYCFRSMPNVVTDTSQTPPFLGQTSGDNLLCNYLYSSDGQEMEMTCHQISNWDCNPIENIRFQRVIE